MRRIIKIFLASSIVEFANERALIENFIRNISDRFEDLYDIKIKPVLCENLDDAVSAMRKQEEYNQKIRESELCFFIFFTKAGQYTVEEFNVAFEKFKESGRPKIYTYFKELKGETPEQSLVDFMEMLNKSLGHYYGKFDHIDTIKLRILLSLKLEDMDFVEIKTEGGRCVVDGKAVMSLDNVAEFANNQSLARLQGELTEVEERYLKMKPEYDKGNRDADFYREYCKVATKRENLKKEIEELQKLIFGVSLRMCQDNAGGEMTQRQKEAYRLFELGDYSGCMSVLDEKDIDDDFLRERRRIKEENAAVCKKYIKEHMTAIEILETMYDYKDRFEEIRSRYEKIVSVALDEKLELNVVYKYCVFLYDQNDHKMALDYAKRLEIILETDGTATDYDKSILFNLLGIIYKDRNDPQSSEEYLLKDLRIIEGLALKEPQKYLRDLSTSYNNIGAFYYTQGYPSEAETYYNQAIKIREKLVTENNDSSVGDLAESYINIGVIYSDQGEPSKAEEYLLKAIDKYEAIISDRPERYSIYLVEGYINAGTFYYNQGDLPKAESFFRKAIKMGERLAEENFDRYSGSLAQSYNNTGAFYYGVGQSEIAESYFLKAIEIRERLTAENPERFGGELAGGYNNIGAFYANQGQPTKAEEYFEASIGIRERLAAENPQRYIGDLATSYNNVGAFYANQNDTLRAEKYLRKAIEIKERLSVDNFERYGEDLADSLDNLGAFYVNHDDPSGAEEYFVKAIEIIEKLAEGNPERYGDKLARRCNDAGIFYDKLEDRPSAEKYFLKTIDVYEGLVSQYPERYVELLVVSYFNMNLFYGKTPKGREYVLKAIELAKAHPDDPLCRSIIDQLGE